MRIAILTTARTGSTCLYHLIENHLPKSYVCISEPFNNHWRDKINLNTYDIDFFENKSDVFIKTFVSKLQRPKSLLENDSKFWIWFFKYFDKIILLDRLDKDLQSESLTYHLKKNDISSWQKPQKYDLSNISKDEIFTTKDILINDANLINEFNKIGYPLFYYEDIFLKKDKSIIESMFDYIGLNLNKIQYDMHIMSDFWKIRIDDTASNLKKII